MRSSARQCEPVMVDLRSSREATHHDIRFSPIAWPDGSGDLRMLHDSRRFQKNPKKNSHPVQRHDIAATVDAPGSREALKGSISHEFIHHERTPQNPPE